MSKKVRSLITVSEHHCKQLYDDLQAMPPAYRASRLRSLAIVGVLALKGGARVNAPPPLESDHSDSDPVASPVSDLIGLDLER